MLCISKQGGVSLFVSTYPSLERTQSGRFDIRCLVGEPEPSGHVHDEAERVPIFNLRHPHALNVPLGALLQLLLHRGRGRRKRMILLDLLLGSNIATAQNGHVDFCDK